MLKVKTLVAKSTIPDAGNGLFANQDISKGTLIWQLNSLDKVIPIGSILYYTSIELEYIKKYAYKSGENLILCSDDAKYINHSKNPNLEDYIDPKFGSVTVAKYDIKAGDELLSDYANFDDDSKNGVNFKNK